MISVQPATHILMPAGAFNPFLGAGSAPDCSSHWPLLTVLPLVANSRSRIIVRSRQPTTVHHSQWIESSSLQFSPCCHVTMLLNKWLDIYTTRPYLIHHQTFNIRCTKSQNFKCFSSHLAVVFAQCFEARCWGENEDVVGAALTGDAPTTSE